MNKYQYKVRDRVTIDEETMGASLDTMVLSKYVGEILTVDSRDYNYSAEIATYTLLDSYGDIIEQHEEPFPFIDADIIKV